EPYEPGPTRKFVGADGGPATTKGPMTFDLSDVPPGFCARSAARKGPDGSVLNGTSCVVAGAGKFSVVMTTPVLVSRNVSKMYSVGSACGASVGASHWICRGAGGSTVWATLTPALRISAATVASTTRRIIGRAHV